MTLAFPQNQSYGAQVVTLSGGVPPYHASSNDTTIATISLNGSSLSISPVLNNQTQQYNAGTTTIGVGDAAGGHVNVTVGVTTFNVTIQKTQTHQ